MKRVSNAELTTIVRILTETDQVLRSARDVPVSPKARREIDMAMAKIEVAQAVINLIVDSPDIP
jgi:hypothetical protein